jgi:adenylate kinase family enzyme
MAMQRINIVGSSGAGKSTLGRQLSLRLGVPHIEIDYLHWEPNWVEVPNDEMRLRVQEATIVPCWIADGSYSAVRDLIWPRIDTVIWLDYSLTVVMWRHLRRAGKRVFVRESCCNGNYETLRRTFSRDSAWYYALTTFGRRRQQIREMLARPEYSHLKVLRFRSPRETQRWLRSLPQNFQVPNNNSIEN